MIMHMLHDGSMSTWMVVSLVISLCCASAGSRHRTMLVIVASKRSLMPSTNPFPCNCWATHVTYTHICKCF